MGDGMPFYRFKCPQCEFEDKKLLTAEQKEKFAGACQVCGTPLVETLGTPSVSEKVTMDEYRNKKVDANIGDKIKERNKEHFEKHELPRIIEKEGKEFAIRQGWLTPEGHPSGDYSKKK